MKEEISLPFLKFDLDIMDLIIDIKKEGFTRFDKMGMLNTEIGNGEEKTEVFASRVKEGLAQNHGGERFSFVFNMYEYGVVFVCRVKYFL